MLHSHCQPGLRCESSEGWVVVRFLLALPQKSSKRAKGVPACVSEVIGKSLSSEGSLFKTHLVALINLHEILGWSLQQLQWLAYLIKPYHHKNAGATIVHCSSL